MNETDSGFLEELGRSASTSGRTISIENIIRRQISKLKSHRDVVDLEIWTACKIDGEKNTDFETEISFLLSALGGLLQVIVAMLECFNNTSAQDCDTTSAHNINSRRCKICRSMNKVIDDNVKLLKKRLQNYLVTVMAPNIRSKNERFSSERQELSKLLRQLQVMHDNDDSNAYSYVIEDVMICFSAICGMSSEFGVIKGELDMVDNVKQVFELLDAITGAMETYNVVQRESKRYTESSPVAVDPNSSTSEAAEIVTDDSMCINRHNGDWKKHMPIILEKRDCDHNNISSRRNSTPIMQTLENVNSCDNVSPQSDTCQSSTPIFKQYCNKSLMSQRPINLTYGDHLQDEIAKKVIFHPDLKSTVACSGRNIPYFTRVQIKNMQQDLASDKGCQNTHSEERILESNVSYIDHKCPAFVGDGERHTAIPKETSVLKDACSKLNDMISRLKQSDPSPADQYSEEGNNPARKMKEKIMISDETSPSSDETRSSLDERTVHDKQRFIRAPDDDVFVAEDLSDYIMLPSTSRVVVDDSKISPHSENEQIDNSIQPATYDNEYSLVLAKDKSSNDSSDNFTKEKRKVTTVLGTNDRTSICKQQTKEQSENTSTDTTFYSNSNRQCMLKSAPPLKDNEESPSQVNKPTPYLWTKGTHPESPIYQKVTRQYLEHDTSESITPEEQQKCASCSENSKLKISRAQYDRMLTDAKRRNDEYVFQKTLEALQNNESIGGIPRFSRSLSDSCLAGLLDDTVDYQTNATHGTSDHGDAHVIHAIIVPLMFLGVALLLLLSSCSHGNLLSLHRPPVFYSVFEVLQNVMELRHLRNPAI